MTAPGKPLAVSLAGHVLLAGALVWLVGRAPPLQLPPQVPQNAIEVAFSALQPAPAPPPLVAPEPPPPPPIAEEPAPPPSLPAVAEEPPPPPRLPVAAAAPPPPPKPVPRRVLRSPIEHRLFAKPERPVAERPLPERPRTEARSASPLPNYAPPVQPAALPPTPPPAPPAAPMVTTGYRAELSAWLESHKQYPQKARERGEQGRVVLRFRVARSGRVLGYSVAGSSGYPDLDAAVDTMMRGAVLPPFPVEMAAPEIDVAVTVRFALTR